MNRNVFIFILLLPSIFSLQNCGKVKTQQVISLEPKTLGVSGIDADDTTVVTIWADIPWQSQGSIIVFTAQKGAFIGGTAIADGGNTISVPANINTHTLHKWSAFANYIAPLIATDSDIVTAYIQGLLPQFTDSLFIKLNTSVAVSITLSSSTQSVQVPFASTATITGMLTSVNGAKISLGTPVTFSLSLSGGAGYTGTYSFSPNPALSDANSTVTTVFNPGILSPDSSVYIITGMIGNGPNSGTTQIFVNH